MEVGDRVSYAGDSAIGTVIEIRHYEFAGDVAYLGVQYPGHVFSCHEGAFTLVEGGEEELCSKIS